ncbi:WG repeat-containing protein [Carboxylicivirga linearis]|uniref:WG repeat-containing protein n=1 Tax=Carboxylicivirga linearis TaxID=1628157 RepID=A0ABS5JW43_9BACT|nr:WG repeat-containing protein [Carboxylicivirga linearis]MBS2098694.1 WG repeat-containing protein [Carboxylicivirga linearis]
MQIRKIYMFLFILLVCPLFSIQAQTTTDSVLLKYDRHWEIKEGLYRVMLDNKMGVVKSNGDIIVPCQFNQVWNIDSEGFFRVLKKGKAGVYHESGKVIIPAEYDQIWSFNNGWAKVMQNGKLGYFNREGLAVVPCVYQQIWSFENGRARVLKEGKVGYINEKGFEIIPPAYQQIWSFENGRARILKDGKVGYIDEEGNEVIAPIYSHIWNFEDGKAKALLDGQMVWIDEKGQLLDIPIDQTEAKETEIEERQTTQKQIVIEDDWGNETRVRIPGGKVIIKEDGNNTYVEIGTGNSKKQYRYKDRRFNGHFTGIELGFANYVSADGTTHLPDDASYLTLNDAQSFSLGLNFLQWSIGLQRRGNIGLVSGLGIEHTRYRLAGPYIITKDENGNTSYNTSDRNIKTNQLTTTYINAPLLLEMQIPTGHYRPFYISGGVIGGFRINSFSRVKYNDNEGPGKEKKTSDFNIRDWRYGVMVRMGYRAINLFGTYYLSTMFEDNKGPEIYPVSVGISIGIDGWDLSR